MNIDAYWSWAQAVELCVKIEALAPWFGFHVALTGGLLYKTGLRKDCDLVFYQIRHDNVDREGFLKALDELFLGRKGGGWRFVAWYHGKQVDLLFPEYPK